MEFSDEALDCIDLIENEVQQKYVRYLMKGYIVKHDKESKSFDVLTQDKGFKNTCYDFLRIITYYASDDYRENLSFSNGHTHINFLRSYEYFNRPKEWKGRNPIDNQRLDEFVLGYLKRPEYQNHRFTCEIIKAYIASAVFDDFYLLLTKSTNSILQKFLAHFFDRSKNKLWFANYIIGKLGLFFNWFFIPLISVFLYYSDYKTLGGLLAAVFGIHLFSKLVNIFSFASKEHQKVIDENAHINRIENTIYIADVVSQGMISIQSLKSLLRMYEGGDSNFVGVYPAPLFMLLDTLEAQGDYVELY